jgi:hypothetical protein
MPNTVRGQRSLAIPHDASLPARDKAPDFRARAMAKQAWLVRRSEPKRGLLLGLLAGGAIGCLGAFAVLSVVPSDGPARVTADNAAIQTAGSKALTDGSNAESREVRQVSIVPAAAPVTRSAAAGPAVAPAATTPANAAVLAAAPAPTSPRADLRPELSSNSRVAAVTPAEPPATESLTAPPILAHGDSSDSKPRVAAVKKKKKRVVVKQRRPQPTDFARRDNFFFGFDRMTNNF